MPVYEFECVKCERSFEVLTFSFKETPDPTCVCGAKAERRFSAVICKTDSFKGVPVGNEQFQGDKLDEEVYIGAAKRAGVSTNGLVYQHGLARHAGDVEAWVRDRGDVKRILEKRGWGAPQLGIKAREGPPPEQVGVANDLVEAELDRMTEAKEIAPHEREKKRYDVADRLTMSHLKGSYQKPAKKAKKRAKR